jgi:dUTP pyrophosphatase
MSQPRVNYFCNTELSTSNENAGYDLRASEATVVTSGERKIVKTELKLEMPTHMYAQVFSRSGLAVKGIDACGGVIDSGYRNTVGVILHNTSNVDFNVSVGDRVAQIVFLPIYHPELTRLSNETQLSDSDRGQNGFGSSGVQ